MGLHCHAAIGAAPRESTRREACSQATLPCMAPALPPCELPPPPPPGSAASCLHMPACPRLSVRQGLAGQHLQCLLDLRPSFGQLRPVMSLLHLNTARARTPPSQAPSRSTSSVSTKMEGARTSQGHEAAPLRRQLHASLVLRMAQQRPQAASQLVQGGRQHIPSRCQRRLGHLWRLCSSRGSWSGWWPAQGDTACISDCHPPWRCQPATG